MALRCDSGAVMAARWRSGKVALWGAVVVGLLVRMTYQHEIRDYVLYRVPLVDAQEYVEWARNLAAGGQEVRDAYYKAPLYPHVLAIAMRVLGPDVETAYRLNLFLGLLDVLLLFAFARRAAGERLARVAAWVAAVYGPFLYYESQAMPTTLAITLALASLVALAEWAERPRGVWLVVSGLAAGFLVLTRPSFLVWVAVAACWVVGRRGLRRGAQALLCFVLPAALVIAPVSLRNYLRSSAWVLVSANGGINFFLGNNPDAARTALLRPGLQWEELVASPPDSARAGQARWDRWFAARGVTWVREHPLGFVAGLVEKSVQYANAHEIDRNLDVRGFKEQSRVLRLAPTYALVAPWVLLGLVVAWRRKGAARLAVLFWLANAAATVLFFVTERYRLDAAPAAIVLAVSAARAARAALRNPEDHPTIDGSATAWRLPLGWVMGLLAAGTVLAFGNFYGIHDIHPADAAQLEGMAYYKEGRYGMAIDRLREALRRNPNDSDAHYQLGTALQKQNHLREALAEYESAHRIAPRSPEPLVNAGWVLRELGEKAPALERYRAASGLRPADASLRLEVGLLEENLGDLDAARASYETILRLAADPAVQRAAREHLAGLERRGAPSPH